LDNVPFTRFEFLYREDEHGNVSWLNGHTWQDVGRNIEETIRETICDWFNIPVTSNYAKHNVFKNKDVWVFDAPTLEGLLVLVVNSLLANDEEIEGEIGLGKSLALVLADLATKESHAT
jgi:hypothetical protein